MLSSESARFTQSGLCSVMSPVVCRTKRATSQRSIGRGYEVATNRTLVWKGHVHIVRSDTTPTAGRRSTDVYVRTGTLLCVTRISWEVGGGAVDGLIYIATCCPKSPGDYRQSSWACPLPFPRELPRFLQALVKGEDASTSVCYCVMHQRMARWRCWGSPPPRNGIPGVESACTDVCLSSIWRSELLTNNLFASNISRSLV